MHLKLNRIRIINAIVGALLIPLGWATGTWLLSFGGAVGLAYALWKMLRPLKSSGSGCSTSGIVDDENDDDLPKITHAVANEENPSDLSGLIEEMLQQGRYALLLRPQIVGNLNDDQRLRTMAALKDGMSLTPAGEVGLSSSESTMDDELTEKQFAHLRANSTWVEGVYLDRHCVTNRQFYQFVASGGYEQMSLWDPEVWPAVMDFVDQTGNLGPRSWSKGRYPRGEDHHPVVGICYYEAAAYARWVGKRLPADAEWVKAASWPVALVGTARRQRKFPWGDAMDRSRANLWGSPHCGIVAVDQYPDGVSVGGVYQLIGNVWEWTNDELSDEAESHAPTGKATACCTLRGLRGGAFDTYFDLQATCQFQSGDHPLARKHNIGFRCALSVCDLAAVDPSAADLNEVESSSLAECV